MPNSRAVAATVARRRAQLRPRGADVLAHARADLHLRLQQLVGDPPAEPLLAAPHEALGRRRHEVAAGRIDQEVLLLESQSERRRRKRHGLACGGAGPHSSGRAWDQKAAPKAPARRGPQRISEMADGQAARDRAGFVGANAEALPHRLAKSTD